MQQLSGLDASFVYMETPSSPMHVAGVSIYDPSTAPGGKVTFKGILANFQQRIHLARTFRQKMVQVPLNLDHPYWVEDKDFDLEFHVRHIALPAPGDWRQLCIQVARLHSRMLDLSRPLWETYVIEGLDNVEGVPRGSFAVLQKTHHAAIDGMSGMEMTSAIHDLTPTAAPPSTPDTWQGEEDPSPMTLLGRAALHSSTRPMHFSRVVARTVPGMGRVTNQLRRRQVQLPPTSAPRTRFNGTVSAHRVVDARRFDLGEIRRMKAAVDGATVNDVVLAIVGGGLRAYLRDKGELPDEPLLAMAPISVRSESEKGSQGNQVSSMVVSLASNVADPLERLTAVRESTHQSKEFTNAVGARTLTEYSQFIPGGLAALAARTASRFEMANRVDPTANCVVTNVPGPREPLYFAGAKLVTMFGMGPIGDGLGLMHPVTSYVNELVIAVTSCREMLPDPAFYTQCLQDSYDELAEAVPTRTPPPKQRSGRRATPAPPTSRTRTRAGTTAGRSTS
jgi:WS/DGAT/MGAT family acyltransferase